MGLLKIRGDIRLEQFWPRGKSESDASKIKITLGNNAFEYKADGQENYRSTNVFAEAYIPYQRKKQKIIKRGNQLLVRLQGVDAPELHYSLYGPTPTKHPTRRGNLNVFDYENLIQESNSIEYRQPMAETAVYQLLTFLSKEAKGGEVPCTFICNANTPTDACDKYGRLVGSIYVTVNKKEIHLNQWLLQNALAFPAFYNSMSVDMIKNFTDLTETLQQGNTGIYKQYKTYIGVFDDALRYRPDVSTQKAKQLLAQDKGHLIYPKIYRRWCIYNIYKLARVQLGSFTDYLTAVDDKIYFTQEYLKNDGNEKKLKQNSLFTLVQHNRFTQAPNSIVFIKSALTLKGEDGKEINTWW